MRRIIKKVVDASAAKKKQKAINDSINSSKAILDGLKVVKKDVEKEVDRVKRQRDKVIEEVGNASFQLNKIKDEIKKLEEARAAESSEFNNVYDKLLGAQKSYKILSKDVEALEKEKSEKQKAVDDEIKTTLSNTRDDLDMARIEYNELEANKNELQKQVLSQEALVKDLKEQQRERGQQIKKLEKDIKASEDLLASKNLANLKASEKIRGLHEEIEKLNIEAEDHKLKVKELEDAKKGAEKELENIKNVTLGFVRREARLKSLVPQLKELYSKAGIEIKL
jgi:myosin protein heavy chain